jgi:hypothetical protein
VVSKLCNLWGAISAYHHYKTMDKVKEQQSWTVIVLFSYLEEKDWTSIYLWIYNTVISGV